MYNCLVSIIVIIKSIIAAAPGGVPAAVLAGGPVAWALAVLLVVGIGAGFPGVLYLLEVKKRDPPTLAMMIVGCCGVACARKCLRFFNGLSYLGGCVDCRQGIYSLTPLPYLEGDIW